jgi:D-xylose transport system permease protein
VQALLAARQMDDLAGLTAASDAIRSAFLEAPIPSDIRDSALAAYQRAETVSDYMRVVFVRIRSGDSGVLPVVGGLLLISILFQWLNPNFLTAGNIVNLLIQGSAYMLLAMGEVFALLLGEIDLSIGFVSGIGGVVAAELVKQSTGWPWWASILLAGRLRALIGLLRNDHHSARPPVTVDITGLLGRWA